MQSSMGLYCFIALTIFAWADSKPLAIETAYQRLYLLLRDRYLILTRSVLHDRGKRFGIEAGAADQSAVNLRLRHERFGVIRLDAAAVEDTQTLRESVSKSLGGF